MKKFGIVGLVVLGVTAAALALLGALGTVRTVSAQGPTQTPYYGQGGMGGRGMGGGMYDADVENEAVHDLMMAAYAEKLNLSVEELNTRTDAGERLSQIALSTGMSFTDFWALKTEVHSAVAQQALADGLITQAQFELMQQTGTSMMNGSGMRGAGSRGGATCGNVLQTTP